ncbi:MAG TPA: BON domain-containing protein [Planctomycetota bacterium]|nr:BON domain-containing protein [Planctomycetota bacterium]
MVTDLSEFSDDELEIYLRELLVSTEELNAKAIRIRVLDDIVYLSGSVPSEQQKDLAQMLVLDMVPEDRIANDLVVDPEVGREPDPEPPDEPPLPPIPEEPVDVDDDPEAAAQEGKTYEPPTAPVPEPKHGGDW